MNLKWSFFVPLVLIASHAAIASDQASPMEGASPVAEAPLVETGASIAQNPTGNTPVTPAVETVSVSPISDLIVAGPQLRIRPLLAFGAAVLFEKTNDQRFQNSVLPPLLGLGFKVEEDFSNWSGRLELSTDETVDGNQTLSLRRRRQSALMWFTKDLGLAQGWVPFVGLAGGMSRSEAVTVLNGIAETAEGNWRGVFAGAAGFRAEWNEAVTVRAELRYESAETLKTNDARSGVAVYIETVF